MLKEIKLNIKTKENFMIKFVKMNGLGNDFVIIDCRKKLLNFTNEQIKKLSDRHFGIGFDQLCFILSPKDIKSDVFIAIINNDGLVVEACGNLTRCVAFLIGDELKKNIINIETIHGNIECEVLKDKRVLVNMGKPNWNWEKIPLSIEKDTESIDLKISGLPNVSAVSMGNPHCVVIVEQTSKDLIYKYGQIIESHSLFSDSTNIEIIEIIDSNNIKMFVWERSIGCSNACGSGACAAVAVANKKNLVNKECKVLMPGGELDIKINNNGEMIMIGNVNISFSGIIHPSLLYN